MVSISPILKMLGIKVSEQDIANVEALIPQIPAKASEIVIFVNNAVTNFHERLVALEKGQQEILKELRNGRTESESRPTDSISGSEPGTRPNGNGSGQHLLGIDDAER